MESSPTKIRRPSTRPHGVVTCTERLIKSLRVNGHGQHLSTGGGGGGGGGGTFLGTHRTSPGKMSFGFVIWGFAAIKASSDTPKRCAIENIESP